MATTTGIWNHAPGERALTAAAATNSAGSGTNGISSSDSATISANDFLSLLVTEMQNQDPTATTDPNEYINQLVNVNSLEQLISINQTLSTAMGPSSGTTATGGATGSGTKPQSQPGTIQGQITATTPEPSTPTTKFQDIPAQVAPGNLSIPQGTAVAQRIAQSLSGR